MWIGVKIPFLRTPPMLLCTLRPGCWKGWCGRKATGVGRGPFSFRPCCLRAYSKPAGLAKKVEIECTHDMLRGKLGEINLFHLSIHPSVVPSMLTSIGLIPYSDFISLSFSHFFSTILTLAFHISWLISIFSLVFQHSQNYFILKCCTEWFLMTQFFLQIKILKYYTIPRLTP